MRNDTSDALGEDMPALRRTLRGHARSGAKVDGETQTPYRNTGGLSAVSVLWRRVSFIHCMGLPITGIAESIVVTDVSGRSFTAMNPPAKHKVAKSHSTRAPNAKSWRKNRNYLQTRTVQS